MKTRAFPAKTPKELDEKIRKIISNGYTPTMAGVFCSVARPLEQVRTVLARHQIAVFGCTSSGEIVNANAFEESITVMLFDLPNETFRIKLFEGAENSSYQLGAQVATWAKQVFETPALLVLSAGLQADGEAIVHGAIESMGSEIPLFGGLAGDDLQMRNTVRLHSDSHNRIGCSGARYRCFKN